MPAGLTSPIPSTWAVARQLIRLCDGLTQAWRTGAFSDVFEEQGVVRSPFMAALASSPPSIFPKPALNIFALLHKLGDRPHCDTGSGPPWPPGRQRRHRAGALWYAPPVGSGEKLHLPRLRRVPKTFTIDFKMSPPAPPSKSSASMPSTGTSQSDLRCDGTGRPGAHPAQIGKLRAAGRHLPGRRTACAGPLELTVPPHGLAVVVLTKELCQIKR